MVKRQTLLFFAVGLLAILFFFNIINIQSIIGVSEIKFEDGTKSFLVTKYIDQNEDIILSKGTEVMQADGTKVKTTSEVVIRLTPLSSKLIAPSSYVIQSTDGRLYSVPDESLCSAGSATKFIPYKMGAGNLNVKYRIKVIKDGATIDSKEIYFGGANRNELETNSPRSISLYGGKIILTNIAMLGAGVLPPELSDVTVIYDEYTPSFSVKSLRDFDSVILNACNNQRWKCTGTGCDNSLRTQWIPYLNSPSGYGNVQGFSFDRTQGSWELYPDTSSVLATISISSDVADAVFIRPLVAKPVITQVTAPSNLGFQKAGLICATIKDESTTGGSVDVTFSTTANLIAPASQRLDFSAGEIKNACANVYGNNAGTKTEVARACSISQFTASTCSERTFSYTVFEPLPASDIASSQLATTGVNPATKTVEATTGEKSGTPPLKPDCSEFGEAYYWDATAQKCVPKAAPSALKFDLIIILILVGVAAYVIFSKRGKRK